MCLSIFKKFSQVSVVAHEPLVLTGMYIFIEINDQMEFVDIIDESCYIFSLFFDRKNLKCITNLKVIFNHFPCFKHEF